MTKSFDVFLSHNSKDKPAVRELARALSARGLKVWLDEWELVPGCRWQEALEEVIETTGAAAVLVGKDGLGPWHATEMHGCLFEFADRKLPVIPVLLPGTPEVPRLPLFLKGFTWVDLRQGLTKEGIAQLHWGITGNQPEEITGPPASRDHNQRKLGQPLPPVPKPYLARPGGPMPEEAANRILRPEDRSLLAALHDAPFTAAVGGPPECGKSTLLNLLAAEAGRRGFAVVEFDAAILLPLAPELSDDSNREVADLFFEELAGELARTVGELPQGRVQTRFDLLRFLKDARLRRPAPPLLIVVYHAFNIPRVLDELIQVCRSLDAQKGRTQLSWAIEVTPFPEIPLGVLSRLAPSPVVRLGWFTPSQVAKLANFYGMEEPNQIQELWDWFTGQPFLSHAALTRYRDLLVSGDSHEGVTAWEQVTQEIEKGEAEFGRHLSRSRARLRWHACSPQWEHLGSGDVVFLQDLGLVDPNCTPEEKSPVLKFYRHHLSRL